MEEGDVRVAGGPIIDARVVPALEYGIRTPVEPDARFHHIARAGVRESLHRTFGGATEKE
jgi:hypothetical protein